jgi:hypothetical protein
MLVVKGIDPGLSFTTIYGAVLLDLKNPIINFWSIVLKQTTVYRTFVVFTKTLVIFVVCTFVFFAILDVILLNLLKNTSRSIL